MSEHDGRLASKAMRAACELQTRGCRIGGCENVGWMGEGALNTLTVVSAFRVTHVCAKGLTRCGGCSCGTDLKAQVANTRRRG